MRTYILFLLLISCGIIIFNATPCKAASPLPVIGAVETLNLEKEKIHLPARIDTGAQTSSLSAVGIQLFERDGKKWVRFQVKDPISGKMIQLERALERIVKIKRHGALAIERQVVTLLVSIGAIRQNCEFSLIDRSDYEYPALIGRNFLNGRAMVDVSREYSVPPLNQRENNAD